MASEKRASLWITLKDEVSAGLGKIKTATTGLTDVYSGLRLALGAVQETFGRLISFLGESLKAYSENETAVKRLNLALQNQGFYTDAYSKDLQGLATQLQSVSTFSDEAILETMQLLTTFGLAGKELKSTTKAALDLSTGLGIDLRTATMLLGKAWEGNTTMLQRYGIVVDSSLSASERFEAVLRKINDRFGGSAQTQASTYAGKIEILKNNFNDLQESIGKMVAGPMEKMATKLNYLVVGWQQVISGPKFAGGKTMGPGDIFLGPDTRTGSKEPSSKRAKGQEELAEERSLAKEQLMARLEALNNEAGIEKLSTTDRAAQRLFAFNQSNIEIEKERQRHNISETEAEKLKNDNFKKMQERSLKDAEQLNARRLASTMTMLSMLASFATAKNKALAAVGKASAIGITIINAHKAAGEALAAFGAFPPLAFAMAGVMEAAGLAQAAQIAGVQLAHGGMIMPSSGGTLASMAEAGHAEVAIPLDDPRTKEKLADTFGEGRGNTVIIQAGTIVADKMSIREFATRIDEELFRLNRNRRSVAF